MGIFTSTLDVDAKKTQISCVVQKLGGNLDHHFPREVFFLFETSGVYGVWLFREWLLDRDP